MHLSNKSKQTQIAHYTVSNLLSDFSTKNIQVVRFVVVCVFALQSQHDFGVECGPNGTKGTGYACTYVINF